jgi:hypothetical protein
MRKLRHPQFGRVIIRKNIATMAMKAGQPRMNQVRK